MGLTRRDFFAVSALSSLLALDSTTIDFYGLVHFETQEQSKKTIASITSALDSHPYGLVAVETTMQLEELEQVLIAQHNLIRAIKRAAKRQGLSLEDVSSLIQIQEIVVANYTNYLVAMKWAQLNGVPYSPIDPRYDTEKGENYWFCNTSDAARLLYKSCEEFNDKAAEELLSMEEANKEELGASQKLFYEGWREDFTTAYETGSLPERLLSFPDVKDPKKLAQDDEMARYLGLAIRASSAKRVACFNGAAHLLTLSHADTLYEIVSKERTTTRRLLS